MDLDLDPFAAPGNHREDRTRAASTHMLCWSCGMYFAAAASSEKYQGSMNFDFEHRAVRLNAAVRRGASQRTVGWRTCFWTSLMTSPVLASYQRRFRSLGDQAELHGEVPREVLRLDLAALLSPQPDQRGLVITHNDAGVRAADEVAATGRTSLSR